MKPSISSLPEWSRPWAEHRLAQALSDISGEQWNGLGDWLTALPIERPKMPAKLHKLTMAQALQASVLWHEDMALRAERIRDDQASFPGDPNAVQVLADSGQGWRWVRVTSPEGLDYEGNAMGHCVGRGGYDTGVTIISLRDKHNMPHCTIEWDEENRCVKQIQGRANGPVVEKYHSSVVSFVNGLKPFAVEGAGKFGYMFIDGKLIHWSELPEGLTLETLDLAGCTGLTHLPDGLSIHNLRLERCTGLRHLPDRLTARYIDLRDCTNLTHLPDELIVHSLSLSGCTGLTELPDGLSVEILNLRGCTNLTHLPNGLNAEMINLWGCTSLRHLPDGLTVERIYLNYCTSLTHLPNMLNFEYLNIVGCTGLTSLPSDLNLDCRVYGGDNLIPRSNSTI